MPTNTSLTLVVPIYNSAEYLGKFFQHLNAQTFQGFQCIFVYDQSEDGTLLVINNLMSKPHSFPCQLLLKPVKEGVGKARDYAIDSGLLNTPYTLFMDCDDDFADDFLSSMMGKAVSTGADITFCGYQRVDGKDGHVISNEMIHNPELVTDLLHCPILPYLNTAAWNKLLKTAIIGDSRFIHKGAGEDAMFFFKIYPNCSKFAFINKPLYFYNVNEDSIAGKTDESYLQVAEQGYLEVRDFYFQHGKSFLEWMPFLEAVVFLKVGVGQTTRVCLSKHHHYHGIIKQSRQYLYSNFPHWKHNRFLSFGSSLKHGFKALMIWRCKVLYRLNWFGLFVFDYKIFTGLFKKDIKW
jgi:glycosyltransferase involved in cell wall biosynthesis